LVKHVSIAAVPIAPPKLRILLEKPEAAPASAGVIPSMAIAEIGVMTIAWPSALTTSGQNSCGG
jgi:hypothetical protein